MSKCSPILRVLPLVTLFSSLLFPLPVAIAQGDDDQIDVSTVEDAARIPADLLFRARVIGINPPEHLPTTIQWRHSGQGLGGDVESGTLGSNMEMGQWIDPVPVASLFKKKAARRSYLSIQAGSRGEMVDRITREVKNYSTGVEMEFEFSSGGKVIKTLTAKGPDGGTFTLVLPFYRLGGGKTADSPEFVDELEAVREYAERRAAHMESLPWAKEPVPKRYSVITDLMGYGRGFSLRHSDPAVVDAEVRTLRQLGVNGLRAAPDYLIEKAGKGEGTAANFNRALLSNAGSFGVVRYKKGRAIQEEAGCPYGSSVPDLTRQLVEKARDNLFNLPFPEVWALTADEIGSVFDGTPEGKSHIGKCDRCAAAYRVFLQERGVTPSELGAADWAEVRPLDLWVKDPNAPKPSLTEPPAILGAYYTRVFNNYTTASMFRSLRGFFDQANKEKAKAIANGRMDSPDAKRPWIYTFALRGNTFLMRGHSLDFFDFYRQADNAFVYETSNRDARSWGWDSYLCDVGRIVNKTMGHELGIYIKPHRGAPIQRALTAASRGFKMIYWYTYGPDYGKGDTFSNKIPALDATSKAARILAASEDVLYGSEWVRPAEVAIVSPFSLNALVQGTIRDKDGGEPLIGAAWEDTKWTYSALTHANVPVDPVDETLLIEEDLSRYKVIYVPSPVLLKKAAEKLEQWVKNGGTLYTNAFGLSRDEAGRPFDSLLPMMGLKSRTGLQMWSRTPLYTSGPYLPFNPGDVSPIPDKSTVKGSKPFDVAPLKLTVGRELLDLAPGAEALAHFEDGGVAAVRNKYGKGTVYLLGFFPGLEYSVPIRMQDYNMQRDLLASVRDFVARPALEAGVKGTVDSGVPLVESVLLKNSKTGAKAVTLMNWGYRIGTHRVREDVKGKQQVVGAIPELIPQKDLTVRISNAGPVKTVRSASLGRSLPVKTDGEDIIVSVPEIQEGDVLLLD